MSWLVGWWRIAYCVLRIAYSVLRIAYCVVPELVEGLRVAYFLAQQLCLNPIAIYLMPFSTSDPDHVVFHILSLEIIYVLDKDIGYEIHYLSRSLVHTHIR